ncbi:MAG: immunoglobulin domain-containing protein [Undibacterium sp.]|nr:immunoglobulin domain-containing protein [Opitutaceae bacterium]
MQKFLPLVFSFGLVLTTRAQSVTDPHVTMWLTAKSAQYARVYETVSDKTSGNAVSTWPRSGLTNGGGGQATNAYSDVQRVAYSTNYVYIQTTGLASYTMGNWFTPNAMTYTSWPTNRAAIHRIPRTPSIPATKPKSGGNGGVLVNGVFVWANGDAQSYSTSTATVSMAGSGVWNRLAGVAEAFNFDAGYGHQPNSGAYHNHINPIALRYQLGDNVTYSTATKTYTEAGTITRHSPIMGWANDGLPIYGPYGYSTATDATGGLRRMVSGFVKRDGTVNLAATGRAMLPVWAASVQGISPTLSAGSYGPSTTTTYAVGGGVTGTYSIGLFAEDYEYLGDLGKTQGVDFDLNRQNVRYCVTPEYPGGTYAYFVCINASGATVFPDIINQEFFGTPVNGTGTVTSISETVTEYVDAGPAAPITVTAAAAGGSVALSWNSAEAATYKVEASSDNATWTTLSAATTSGGLTTSYTATTATNYYRVTLTAIASYDTGGTYGTAVGKTAIVSYGAAVTAPTITTQPASVSVTAGASATFTVAAGGTGTLSYQWKKSGSAISGATGASYTIATTGSGDAGSYTATVTNSVGLVTSAAATLTVSAAATAPTITTQPTSLSVTSGGSATFTVVANGTAPLSYQWYKGGVAIAGATAASHAITGAQSANAGSYTCVVTNSAGSATSDAATLTVSAAATAPAITTQPASAAVTVGSGATFTVTAAGTSPLSYQWYKGGAVISGATAASYTLASAAAGDAGSYAVTVTNSAGAATSSAATLTISAVAVAPSIATQPVSLSVLAGGAATFTVVANGAAPFTYQWSKDGVAISGATSSAVTVANVLAANGGNYVCVVTNAVGSATTNAAGLLVAAVQASAPMITTQPVSASAATGASATFTIAANGAATLSYQWRKDGTAITGAAGASYTITAAQSGDAGAYACVVSNRVGSATSAVATLTVNVVGTSSARLVNLAVRARVGGAGGKPITGFVLVGTGAGKPMIIRAAGPAPTGFGLAGALADP